LYWTKHSFNIVQDQDKNRLLFLNHVFGRPIKINLNPKQEYF